MKTYTAALLATLLFVLSFKATSQKRKAFSPKEIYKTEKLVLTQVSPNTYQHTSFLQTNDFGYVPCNGLIVKNGNEVIIYDTPTNDQSSEELIKWVQETLKCKINAIVVTHFHNDCLGGLKAFHNNKTPSFAYNKTIALAKEDQLEVPQNGFENSLVLKVGKVDCSVKFFGEGHTKDNVVGYFPADDVMFGGCLIKELKASKGYLGDANVAEWSSTVQKVKQEYPNVKLIIPGHGQYGDQKLLDYTIELFRGN